jgi:hypothetical protein
MPMIYILQQYKEIAMILLGKSCEKKLSLFIGLFYLSGEPISLHLLRCDPFAVDHRYGPRLAGVRLPSPNFQAEYGRTKVSLWFQRKRCAESHYLGPKCQKIRHLTGWRGVFFPADFSAAGKKAGKKCVLSWGK